MRLIATLLLLSITTGATAAVYKWVQPDGSIIYSDHPPQDNASPANLPPVQEIKIAPPPPSSPETTPDERAEKPRTTTYTNLAITEPTANSTIRSNGGQVSVKLDLEPPLQKGDSIAVVLDGKELGTGKGTTINLSNVARGDHSLRAVVRNAQGDTVIRSSTITFHLLRASARR